MRLKLEAGIYLVSTLSIYFSSNVLPALGQVVCTILDLP